MENEFSRIKNEVQNLKKSLEKSIKDNDFDQAGDILNIFQGLNLTSEMIPNLKVGNIIADFRKKIATQPESSQKLNLLDKTKHLLLKWKKIIENDKLKYLALSSVKVSDKDEKNIFVEQQQKKNVDLAPDLIYSLLSDSRRKVIKLFSERLGGGSTSAVQEAETADQIARNIESAVYNSYPQEKFNKEYSSKVRSLAFNINKNKCLKGNVLNGTISPNELVTMTIEQLATEEVKSNRQRIGHEDADGRRLDWVSEHLVDIKSAIGLDPNNVWIYDKDEDNSDGDCTKE